MLQYLYATRANKSSQHTCPSASKFSKQYRLQDAKRNKHNNVFNKHSVHMKGMSPCFKQDQANSLSTPRFPA